MELSSRPYPRTVALIAGMELALLNMAFAKELKRRTSCRVIFYTAGAESVANHEKFRAEGCIDEIVDRDLLFEAAAKPVDDPDPVFARAREMELFIGCTYNLMMASRRDIGRGFALGGFYHPRAPEVDRLSYVQVVAGLNANLEFWKAEIATRGIDLVINGHKDAAVVARAMGVPFRLLYSSRHQNYYYWAEDEFLEIPGLKAAYDRLAGRDFPPVVLDQPYLQEVKHRVRVLQGSAAWKLARTSAYFLMRRAYLRLKGYHSRWGYSLPSLLAFHYRKQRDLKRLRFPNAQRLSALEGKRFVFFPLQTEPEQSLQWMSPECLSQLGVIASLARDLPVGTVLAVKETIHGAGRRPRDFYAQIREFKNVTLLDVTEKGIDVIKRSAGVAAISGTAGMEAAMMGKPVVLFGRHNGYQFLPHVHLVTREEDLRAALGRMLDASNPDRAIRDGARFREAIIQASFDLRSYNNTDLHSFDAQTVSNAVDALLLSLGRRADQPVAASV